MAHRRPPSFFKILLDASAPHLPLPPDFVTRHLQNKIPKNPMIRSAIGGYSWRLKIKKIGESYCFSDGWYSVVTDIQLGFGDFLVFRFDEKSVFKMFVYSPNGCEKDFPPKIEHDSGVVDDDDDVVEEVDDDDDVVVEDAVEVEEDEIEDEDDDNDEEEYIEEEEDDDDDDDDDGGGFIDGDDGDPYFTSIISQTHKNVLRLPAEFTELAGINGEGTLTLKNLDGKEWKTVVERWNQSERYCISSGWDVFRRSNDLCDGDECVFKFISSEDKLLLARVTKKRRPVRQLQTSGETTATVKKESEQAEEHSGEVPVSEDVKKREGGLKEEGATPVSEVVKREIELPERNSGEVPVVEKRKRGRPARGGGGGVEASGEAPASEVVKRRVQPKRNSGEVPAIEGEKMTRGRAARERGGGVKPSGKTPASKTVKRKRPARGNGGGVKSSGKTPASEAVKRKRKREQPQKKSGELPAMKVEKRKRGRVAREAVKRSRGRPPKQ